MTEEKRKFGGHNKINITTVKTQMGIRLMRNFQKFIFQLHLIFNVLVANVQVITFTCLTN